VAAARLGASIGIVDLECDFRGTGMSSMKSIGENIKQFKQYGMVAAGSLGLTGGRAPSGPIQAQIGISDPCNHECVFCWDHPPKDREDADTADRFGGARAGVMSLQQFKGIVDDLHDSGTRRIDLVGRGEPLLNRSALNMVRYVKARGMHLVLCTNAARLFEPIAKEFVAVRVDRVNISLNAGTPETYPHIHVTETPQDYLKVKKNLRFLADCKIAAGSKHPVITLSFVISSRNYFEIASMVEVAHEVGAQEVQFVHTVIRDSTSDLALSNAQYQELQASLPAVRDRAAKLELESNLETFAATSPPYMPSEMVGLPVVPCYVGWYFTVVLGNGSVMPCCQCASPVGQVTKERRFAEVWASRDYEEFRTAARSLPKSSDRLQSCECGNCQLRPRNVAIHNLLHPLNKLQAGEETKYYSKSLLARLQGKRVIS
jgi:MoaA/NifB/PqqE/SkfB family radical SAM enzyme